MRLFRVVKTGDSVRDGAFESVGISEGTIGEIMLFEIAPASLDVIQLGGVFRQPFDGEPGAFGESTGCQPADVDRPVVENRDQGPGAFGGAVGGAELVEEVSPNLGDGLTDQAAAVWDFEGTELAT